jgi:hypothetical protein
MFPTLPDRQSRLLRFAGLSYRLLTPRPRSDTTPNSNCHTASDIFRHQSTLRQYCCNQFHGSLFRCIASPLFLTPDANGCRSKYTQHQNGELFSHRQAWVGVVVDTELGSRQSLNSFVIPCSADMPENRREPCL